MLVEVHSKDFVIQWVAAPAGAWVQYKIVPIKRGVNFGVFQRLSSGSSSYSPDLSHEEGPLSERLQANGLEPLPELAITRLQANETMEGTIQPIKSVGPHTERMLAFVLDNTFSKSNAKTIECTFSVTPPTADPVLSAASDPALAASAAASALYGRLNQTGDSVGPLAHANTSAGTVSSSPSQSQGSGAIKAKAGESTAAAATALHSASVPRRLSVHTTSFDSNVSSMSSSSQSTLTGVNNVNPGGSLPRRRRSTMGNSSALPEISRDGRFLTGVLLKKRRKKLQGYVRRYFSLDLRMGLLNYYLNQRSSYLRGVMPVKISTVTTSEDSRDIYLDSGMEKWSLRALDSQSFKQWAEAFRELQSKGEADASFQEQGAQNTSITEQPSVLEPSAGLDPAATTLPGSGSISKPVSGAGPGSGLGSSSLGIDDKSATTELHKTNTAGDDSAPVSGDWSAVSSAVSDLNSFLPSLSAEQRVQLSVITSKLESARKQALERQKPRSSSGKLSRVTSVLRRRRERKSRSASDQALSQTSLHSAPHTKMEKILYYRLVLGAILGIGVTMITGLANGYIMKIFIGIIVGALSGTGIGQIGEYLTRKNAKVVPVQGLTDNEADRYPLDAGSGGSDAIYESSDTDGSDDSDIEEGHHHHHVGVHFVPQQPPLSREGSESSLAAEKTVRHYMPPLAEDEGNEEAIADSSSTTAKSPGSTKDTSVESLVEVKRPSEAHADELAENAETSLYPLPHQHISRRKKVAAPTWSPPSLLAMLKKASSGSGSQSAPAATNEPLTVLQRVAEMYDEATMLDKASKAGQGSAMRLMYVALFALSTVASNRCKERALRKPFTPLLGETYEMVREDMGFRFVAEKVNHKPLIIATQAESPLWTVHFTSRPFQKVWAKSVQFTDPGPVQITFPDGESVSFNVPELFLRNILAGERYIDPSGQTHIESSNGQSATIEFKTGGMFSGRSEDIRITSSADSSLVFQGKWTEAIYHGHKQIWKPISLIENAPKVYGWTTMTPTLNETTVLEKGHLPPTDSRLRPDQLAMEKLDIAKAEQLKADLEQRQRERRGKMEAVKKQFEPAFFAKSNDAHGFYVLHSGSRNYWVRRKAGDWSDVPPYLFNP